jgi:hypothetical protein
MYGVWRTVYRAALKVVNMVVLFKILRCVCVECVDPEFLHYPESLTGGFLSEPMIRRFAADDENGMSRAFVEEALAKGDECYGILSQDALVSYGWYSKQPTRIDPPELLLEFSKDYIYMYKGYTHIDSRGQRLHGIGMSLALQHYIANGHKGIVSYIEADNFASINSSLRMGYRIFGSIYIVRALGASLSYATSGCRKFDFRVYGRKIQKSMTRGPSIPL